MQGALRPRSGSPPATPLASPGLPPAGTPKPLSDNPEGLEVVSERKHLRVGTPSRHPPLAGSLSRQRRGSLPGSRGSRGEPLSWRPRGPGSPQLCSVSGAQGRGHLPYTPARKSKTNADLHRGDSFVLQRLAITTADGGSEEEMEEEEELGPDAAATEPPAAPCALRGGGRGRGGAAAAAARPRSLPLALPQQRASSHPGRRESPTRGGPPGGRGRSSARGREARRRRKRDYDLARHRLAGAARRSASRDPRSSVRSAIIWPACLGSRPALRRTFPVSGLVSPRLEPRSKAVPIDERAREHRPRGSRELGSWVRSVAPLQSEASAMPLRVV